MLRRLGEVQVDGSFLLAILYVHGRHQLLQMRSSDDRCSPTLMWFAFVVVQLLVRYRGLVLQHAIVLSGELIDLTGCRT